MNGADVAAKGVSGAEALVNVAKGAAYLRELMKGRMSGLEPSFPPNETYTARGFCGWCASPFMRPVEVGKYGSRCPVWYCKRACMRRAKEKRQQIRDHAHLCPTPEKRVFVSEPVGTREVNSYAVPNGITLRVYHCYPGCLGWHPTSKPGRSA